MMRRVDAKRFARDVYQALPQGHRDRLKAIDVVTRLHSGMLTVRCYFYNQVAEDPEPYNFARGELVE